MKDNELQALIDLRAFLIHKYKNLDGKSNPDTSVMLQRDVANLLEYTIGRVDNVLSPYVNIAKKR
jgi:uncharacterized protein YutE (UPF0331/DUF86 family)